MKDSYSLRRRRGGLDVAIRGAVRRLQPDLRAAAASSTIVVGADIGMMGGTDAHEFMAPHPSRRGHPGPVRPVRLRGEPQIATFRRSPSRSRASCCRARRSRRRAPTTIEALAAFLGIPHRETAKAVFFVDRRRAASSSPSSAATSTSTRPSSPTRSRRGGLRPATRGRDPRRGQEPGYGSPVGVARDDRRRRRRARCRLAQPGRRREQAPATTCATSTPAATTRADIVADIATPRRATPARTAARRCDRATASRSATSSSSARRYTDDARGEVSRRGRRARTRS